MLGKKYIASEVEDKWRKTWQEEGTYKFDETRGPVFSIDTPPPTVSGKIHIGHIFSYTQTEMIARYKRLSGCSVFYPFGFDDNGLPTERLVEKETGKTASLIGREAFSNLCLETALKYQAEFKELFDRLGVSADWNLAYHTVSKESSKISQRSFLELAEKGLAYQKESPALWCPECHTTIAQAEVETKERTSLLNYLTFKTEEGEDFVIATTRPELLPAIVAVFINPEDEKHKHLIGKKAVIPLVNEVVPIIGDEKALMDKGSGIVMCCTFGDQTDIEWWQKYKLPLKIILTSDGRLKEEVKNYGGLKIKEARTAILDDLDKAGVLVKQEELKQEVGVHERCSTPVEYNVMKQWFIKLTDHKEDFLKMGDKITWHPEYMKHRYNDWVNNVLWDWCISRQRYFGVPFPLWTCDSCGEIIYADDDKLPVNPLVDKPSKPCPKCGGTSFTGEKDVMDTWMTSSVSPLINMKYKEEDERKFLHPMSLRSNASDIIRTWDFYTIVKSFYHFNNIPWENVMISGFVMASKGEKISKSKNNAGSDPISLMKEHSADALRYWAGSGRLGTDITYSEETIKRGKKLINKLFNVAKFIYMHLEDFEDRDVPYEFIDKWILEYYKETEEQFINYLDNFEVGLALNTLEKFFWNFCDDYIEIVKHRLYRPEEFSMDKRLSGQKTVRYLLFKLLQDFSIFLPYVTEEIYRNLFTNESIHLTKIEKASYDYKEAYTKGEALLDLVRKVRGEKTNHLVSLKTPVAKCILEMSKEYKEAFDEAYLDLKAALFLEDVAIIDIPEGFNVKEIILKEEE